MQKINYQLLTTLLMFLLALDFVIADQLPEEDFNIKIDKSVYNPGDEVTGTIMIHNPTNENVEWILEKYFYPNKPLFEEEPFFNRINLKPYETKIIEYTYPIGENSISGEYIFEVTITSANLFERTRREKRFQVIGTKKTLLISLKVCKEVGCRYNEKMFIQNQDINIDYVSEVQGISITAVLTFPDKSTKQLTLPSSIKADQIGTYELEVTASKEGYKTISKQEQFAVIEEEVVVISTSECNGNDVCDNNENSQNCPQDCPQTISQEVISPEKSSVEQIEKTKTALYSLFFVVIVLGVILLVHHSKKR